ncbi:MAG: ATP-binding protein [Candidatus Heimdallarchaeota archaeon]
MSSEKKIQLRFKVDSKILKELGESLISRPSIALAELVKNTYDADSTKVVITFKDITRKDGIIIIQDNGEGISQEKLEKAWMTVSTTDKVKNPISKKYGRIKTGEKGVGRFACQAISKTLVLETIAEYDGGIKRKIVGTFYWNKFDFGVEIIDIPIDFTITDVHPDTQTGTKLTLYKLNKMWDEDDVKQLRKEILGLIVPFDEEEFYSGGFDIIFEISEFDKYSGKLSQDVVRKAWGELTGSVSETGMITYNLKTDREVTSIDLEKRMKVLGVSKFKIYYHYMPKGTRRATRKAIKEIGGVRVYVDGFRVFGYGQPDDDWLDLEKDVARRLAAAPMEFKHIDIDRPLLRLPPNKNLVGGVFLSRTNNLRIKQTVNRDRLMQNEAYEELKYFIRRGIDWLTIKFAQYYNREQIEKRQREKKKRELEREKRNLNSKTIIRNIEKTIKEEKIKITESIGKEKYGDIVEDFKDLKDSLKIDKDLFENKESELVENISTYRLLASVGTTVFMFEHEIFLIIDYLNQVNNSLKDLSAYIDDSKTHYLEEISKSISRWHENIEKMASLMSLIKVKQTIQRRRRISVRTIIDSILDIFQNYLESYNIVVNIELDEFIRTPPMYTWEVQSIFLNLLTNSIKALVSPNNKNDRSIRIWGEDNSSHIIIRFQDTGIGIQPDSFNKIFDPFYSTSEPNLVFGQGLGLGLTIVRDIIFDYNGEISFNKNMRIGALAKIILPKK